MVYAPDCDFADEPPPVMDRKTLFDEPGELKCSDLEMPLFEPDMFESVFALHLHNITNKQWMLLAQKNIDSETVIVLAKLCDRILDMACVSVLDVVAPQVQEESTPCTLWDCTFSESYNTNSSVTMEGFDAPLRNYCRVTPEDIQASLGQSLHCALQQVEGMKATESEHLEQLLQLVGEEVARRVNQSLLSPVRPGSQKTDASITPDSTRKDIILCLAKLLGMSMFRRLSESSEGQSDSWDEDMTNVEGLSVEGPLSSVTNTPTSDILGVSVRSLPSTYQVTEHKENREMPHLQEGKEVSKEELQQEQKTFLQVFLSKLLDHIACSSNTSLQELNLDRIYTNLIQRTVRETRFALPKTVGELHITIFKKLCKQFGSAKQLQAAIVSEDVAFEEAVVKELILHLQKTQRNPSGFFTTVRRFFRSNKVAPACEVDTPLSHSEESCIDSESPFIHQQERRSAISRMFSAASKILKKPFTCGP